MWKACAEAPGVGVAVAARSNALKAMSKGHRKTVRMAGIADRKFDLTTIDYDYTPEGEAAQW